MKCKLSEKCEFGNLCKDATRHDSLTVLGCSSFKTKKPLTNEEWFNTLTTEEKANWLADTFDLCGAGCSNCFVKEMCFVDQEIMPEEMIVEWLKQPHQ